MKTNQTFARVYQQLNFEQKQAVDKIEGPVMLMAGPGTGKTHVLATRVAKILLEQDINPENILALTFTDAAAQNMRERIVSMIGTDGFYVNIMTFHSFASEVINNYPEKFPIESGSMPLSDFERFEIFEDIITNTKLELLKPLNSQLYYLTTVMKRVSDLKREYITSEKFESILQAEEKELNQAIEEYWQIQQDSVNNGKKPKTKLSSSLLKLEKNYHKQKELLTLYVKYQNELKKRKRYDFDDMITFVVAAFESDEDLLLDYQERFHYILVDEYQDTNAAQNKIVELLGSFWPENPNIFVVGDPHQSIFRFQGASTENMLEFVSKYPTAKVITLKTGYRCQQRIYDAAYDLISNNILDFNIKGDVVVDTLNKALTQKLQSDLNEYSFRNKQVKTTYFETNNLTTFAADSETMELLFVVEEIKKLQKKGVLLEQIAILYRNNNEATALQEALEKWGIDFELSVGGNVLDDLLIQQLLNFLQVVHDLTLGIEAELLFEVMQYSWLGLNRVNVYKLARIAGKMYKSIGEVLELEYSKISENYGLVKEDFNDLVQFKTTIMDWYYLSKNMLFHEWFSLLLSSDNSTLTKDGEIEKPNGFGFMEFVLNQPIKTNHLFAINSLFTSVKQFVNSQRNFSLDDFLERMKTMQEHNLKIKVEDFKITKNRVSLSTVHSAKGKEWQYVFLIGAVDKKWGNSVIRDLLPLPDSILTNVDVSRKEKNEDDRRLFYVAITRAIKRVYLSWSKVRTDGKDLLASMFITQIGEHLTHLPSEETLKLIENSESLLTKLLINSSQTNEKYSQQEKEFLIELVNEFKLSVTALNNYLKDPHEFMINSLLRIPRAKTPILSFGTAVHFALEQFNNKSKQGKVLTKEEFFSQFEHELKREFISHRDFIDRLEHGRKVLSLYFDEVLLKERQTNQILFVERFFGGKLNQTILFDSKNEIKLSGRMDRVDLLSKDSKSVKVVDYKTGKPKSDNIIVGKSSTFDYSERELCLPETIKGRLQRQMVFYKLLASLDKTFPYNVEQVEFDFVEPGGAHQDKHITRSFMISDKAVDDLKDLIKQVMQEIRELKFLEVVK